MMAFGIDPGSRRTGWGAVRVEGTHARAVDFGVIRLPERLPLADRLMRLHGELGEILRRVEPSRVFLESIFHSKNARSALVLGHARGVAILVAAQSGAALGEISPAEVKRAVTGHGRADKHQVQQMVKVLLGLSVPAAADASDALAVAFAGAVQAESPLAAHASPKSGSRAR